MSAREALGKARRRFLGVAFLAVLALFVWFSLALYQKKFTPVVLVDLRTDRVGSQLMPESDVKVRGLAVGQVRQIRADGAGAVLQLAMDPDKIDLIPRNTKARLLPKTLFGERYVSLVLPEKPAQERLSAGDSIQQDRSREAVELEHVLGNLMPALQAVEPAKLASTLTALSNALDGRGRPLGETLVQLNDYLREINPALPAINEDISRLADVSDTYSKAAPDLIQALSDLTATSRTLVEQRGNLEHLYASVTHGTGDLDDFLRANGENLIRLNASSRPTLEVLAKYAPEYPCLLKGLSEIAPRMEDAWGKGTDKPGLRITLEVTENRGKYVPNQDEPRYADKRGPRCYDISPRPDPFPQYPPDGPVKDGSKPPPAARTQHSGVQPALSGMWAQAKPAAVTNPTSASASPVELSLPNSLVERKLLAALLAARTDLRPDEVPGWSSLLVGPLFRGAEVTLR
ncbi:ABC transporter substrate-binding protein [Longimycelium tulufanense]|uniref:ABC transporter substrate-binding protein n=1 Tax=Longimycelium tulufanense TaxID=907463 RepID=A0A8J3FUP8_9PSEU|nr:MCE family protein [Longimycelium tulufanense]GGM52110.1 ABC transporter substrate-binding protein [Longimycelium tulufanense]